MARSAGRPRPAATAAIDPRPCADVRTAPPQGPPDEQVLPHDPDLQREVEKLERSLGGIREMKGLPDAIFVIDTGYQKGAVVEAKKLGIPVIGVVDTNNSPEGIDYVIPGNDDSSRAIRLYARGIADAVLEGRAQAIQEIVAAAAAAEQPVAAE